MKNHNYMKLMKDVDDFINVYQGHEEFGDIIKSFNNGNEDGNIILRFEGDVGAKYRIAVPYLEKLYIVFWFQFCADGSLYFGVRDKNSEHHESGTVKSIDGQIAIDMNRALMRPKISEKKTKDRFSFHGSGEIHDGEIGHTTYREPIIQTKELRELFWVCFRELSYFEEVHQLRQDDISLMMNVKEKHMLTLHALISPSDKVQLHGINDGKSNTFLIIDFQGIKEIGDITLQLVFAPSTNAEVPPRSIVIWPTIDEI